MEAVFPEMALTQENPLPKSAGIKPKEMGYTLTYNGIIFRLLAPRATQVFLVVFDNYEHLLGTYYSMEMDEEGIWEYSHLGHDIIDKWYAYKIEAEPSPLVETTDLFIADPWSKHVTSRNHYLGFAKTKILKDEPFDWEETSFVSPEDPRDLIIYETHIKDLVAHPSARTFVQGIYNDFWQAKVGGLKHLKRLGVNAVEFLPLQKFAYFEPPYRQRIHNNLINTWNTYERNYWGYMTSFFFAPETVYASDASLKPGNATGLKNRAIKELKTVVKKLHQEKITVIMDVVYNHASQYDLNPLRYTAKDQFFRIDENGNYLNESWTGNDINTANTYARHLIVESVKYWMTEFHIDGFRFDLAGIIDWQTVDMIKQEAEKINPNVLLIAEPWGGEYKPAGFSDHGWISWNDKIRNGFKGYDPVSGKGMLFGNFHHGDNRFSLENFIRGTLRNDEHGLFNTSAHSLNYIESHDGYTFGDFIRIALNPAKRDQTFSDKLELTPLNKKEMAIAKLGALSLFVSQGLLMLHAGQEWARSKMIIDPNGLDTNAGKLDRDSYNKDNETNWLNFNEIEQNKDLFNYYRGLIKLRKSSPALRKAKQADVQFKVFHSPLHITFSIDGLSSGDPYDYFISINADPNATHKIDLPEGDWQMVGNFSKVDPTGIRIVKKQYRLATTSGVILRRLRLNRA